MASSTNDLQFGPSFMRGRASRQPSGHLKSPNAQLPDHSQTTTLPGVPTPAAAPLTPSLGAFASPANVNGTGMGEAHCKTPSFSAVVSPDKELGGGVNGLGPWGGPGTALGKERSKYLYSSTELLAMYMEDKVKDLPAQLDPQDPAVSEEAVGPPLGLIDMSTSEKELFSGPFNSDRRNAHNKNPGGSHTTSHENGSVAPDTRLPAPRLGKRGSVDRFGGAGFQGGVLGAVGGGPGRARARAEDEDGRSARYPRNEDPISPTSPWVTDKERRPRDERWGSKWKRDPVDDKEGAGQTRSAIQRMRERAAAEAAGKEELTAPITSEQEALASSVGAIILEDATALPMEPPNPNTLLDASQPLSASATLGKTADPGPANGNVTPEHATPTVTDIAVEGIPWEYRDPSGKVQGPFTAFQMQEWYKQAFFRDDLLVKRVADVAFETLETLILRVGDRDAPFYAKPPPALPPNLPPPSRSHDLRQQPPPPLRPFDSRSPLESARSFLERSTWLSPTFDRHSPNLVSGYGASRVHNSTDPWCSANGPTSAGLWGQPPPPAPVAFQQPSYSGPFTSSDPFHFPQQPHTPFGPGIPIHGPHAVANLFSPSPEQSFGAAPHPFTQGQQAGGFIPSPFLSAGVGLPGLGDRPPTRPQFNQVPPVELLRDSTNTAASDPWEPRYSQAHPVQEAVQKQESPISIESALPISSIPEATDGPGIMSMTAPAVPPIDNSDLEVRPEVLASRAIKAGPIGPRSSGKSTPLTESPRASVSGASGTGGAIFPASPEGKSEDIPLSLPEPQEPLELVKARSPVTGKVEPQTVPSESTEAARSETLQTDEPWQEVTVKAPQIPSKPVEQLAPQVPSSVKGGKLSVITRARQEEQERRVASIAKAQQQLKEAQAVERAAKEAAAALAPSPSAAAPWSLEDKKAAAGPSLAEIQAAEAKAAEKRRVAEKQAIASKLAMEQAAAAERATKETREGLPITTNWAGVSNSGKTSPAMPWAENAAPKQMTMKQIQEEEARKKAAVAAKTDPITKAGYAGSVGPTAQKALAANGGPWSVVGKGKVTAPPPQAAVARPASIIPGLPGAVRSNPSPIVAAPASPAPRPPIQPRSSTLPVKPAPAIPDAPPPPSAELMKWIREALKGMNNVEDFIKMLLEVPLNPDEGMMEILSDSVYSGSATLDGRRFVQDYVKRRQADAAGRNGAASKGSTVATPKKPNSMADAVKSAAPQQPNNAGWGFAVVTKKKKSNR